MKRLTLFPGSCVFDNDIVEITKFLLTLHVFQNFLRKKEKHNREYNN